MHIHVLILAMFNVQRAITPKVSKTWVTFHSSCKLSPSACVKFHENIEQTWVHSRNGYFQYLLCSKGRNSKSRLIRLSVFCALHVVLYICEKFHNYISNGVQLTERTQVHGRNGYVQCSKSNNSISRQTRVTVHVFCMCRLIVFYICVKLCKNISDSTRVMDRTQMMKVLMDG